MVSPCGGSTIAKERIAEVIPRYEKNCEAVIRQIERPDEMAELVFLLPPFFPPFLPFFPLSFHPSFVASFLPFHIQRHTDPDTSSVWFHLVLQSEKIHACMYAISIFPLSFHLSFFNSSDTCLEGPLVFAK